MNSKIDTRTLSTGLTGYQFKDARCALAEPDDHVDVQVFYWPNGGERAGFVYSVAAWDAELCDHRTLYTGFSRGQSTHLHLIADDRPATYLFCVPMSWQQIIFRALAVLEAMYCEPVAHAAMELSPDLVHWASAQLADGAGANDFMVLDQLSDDSIGAEGCLDELEADYQQACDKLMLPELGGWADDEVMHLADDVPAMVNDLDMDLGYMDSASAEPQSDDLADSLTRLHSTMDEVAKLVVGLNEEYLRGRDDLTDDGHFQ